MLRPMRMSLFSAALIVILHGFAAAAICPQGDLTGNCKVDWEDILTFAEQWLDSSECEELPCADFDGLNGINFIDFAFLSNHWQQIGIPLVINEFMASNNSESDINDPQGEFDDWLEIYNFGDIDIDLGGMYLTDDLDDPTKWQIPEGYPAETNVPADGFILFWADGDTGDGPLHASFKLSADGEDIRLFLNADTMIDGITFGEQVGNISYGRYPDADDNMRFFAVPTPLADNNAVYIDIVEQPEFSHERGFYETGFNVTIATPTGGADVYYTTDGSEPIVNEMPSATSTEYTGTIAISSNTCLRAAAIKTGWMPSRTETHTCIFNANAAIKAMPVISIVGDANESLYVPNGVMAIVGGTYASGVWTSGGDPNAYNNPMGYGILYERPVSVEIIDLNAGSDYQTNCGVRIHGSERSRYTLGEDWLWCTWYDWGDAWENTDKFAFRLYFRSLYGDNRLEYPFFPFTPEVGRHKCIVLRGGHNDACTPFIKDEWVKRLFKQMGGVQLTGAFANLYINGEYKAYYNPCGRDTEQAYQEWYGTDNGFDIINQSAVDANDDEVDIRDGDLVAWLDFLDYIDSHDLSDNNAYEYVSSQLDITDFIDYLIVQIYSSNFDWPNKNWVVHREKTDGAKFRFTIWDAEGIETWFVGYECEKCYLTAFEDCPSYLSQPKGLNNGRWPIPRIYRALKANPDFRQLFADRIHKHFRNGGTLMQTNLSALWWETFNEVSAVLPSTTGYARFIPDYFIPQREPYVLAAFEDNGLFNLSLEAPTFFVNGFDQYGGYISTSDTITITKLGSGTIYYTTDGNDPKVSGTVYVGETPPSTLLVEENAAKKVRVPTGDIGTTWRGGSEPYNDSSWTSGTGGVGYEMDSSGDYDSYIDVNVAAEMYGSYNGCYIRIPFTVDGNDLVDFTSLTLRVMFDDGFVAYINGNEVKRDNFTGTPEWDSTTDNYLETSGFTSYNITSHIDKLQAGDNILAIHGMNNSTGSSDFLICTELEATFASGGGFTLSRTTHLKARVIEGGEWSALNEAVYALPEVADNVRITEIMYHPQDTNDPNDPNEEYIELKNIGASAINLNLVSFTEGINFTFPILELAAGGHILVVKNIDAFEAQYGTGKPVAGQYIGSLANGGERIRLEDAMGTTILDFSYSDGWRPITDGEGYSLTIVDATNPDVNSWAKKDFWRASAYINGSPGTDDSGIIPNPGDIVINEVMSHSHAEAPDWIELYNTTAGPINIGGWYLSDNDSNLMKYRIANGTTINSGGYLVFYEDVNFGQASSDPGKLVPFALSENGETVCLTSALDVNGVLTGYRQREDFEASETGVSFGRYYKASTNNFNFVAMDYNTPGSANAYPKVGPIVISEIMYHPDWPAGGSYENDQYEYIELHNISSGSVTLYDYAESEPWKLSDGIDYTFPDNPNEVIVPAGGYILVVKNPDAFFWRYSPDPNIVFGPYDGKLNNGGEKVELGKPGDEYLGTRYYIRVDRVSYSDGSHPQDCPGNVDLWPIEADGGGDSLTSINPNLYGNDPNNWFAETPSPGNP